VHGPVPNGADRRTPGHVTTRPALNRARQQAGPDVFPKATIS